jgi:hypothetical protein
MNQLMCAFRIVFERRFSILAFTFTVTLFSTVSLHAEEIVLSSPVNCTDAQCFIQRMPDQLSGSEYQDYQCGSFSSNGYKSTDIRVKRATELVKKIPVMASLDGVVDAVRDGMPDGIFTGDKAAFIKGKECGNGVYLSHDNGVETQYCHLRKGSVKVKKGEHIKVGKKIAEMGLSGRTNFPHLEFRLIKNNKAIDPFNGKVVETGCSIGKDNSLWKSDALKNIDLATTHLVSAGFSSKIPTLPAVVLGLLDQEKITTNLPAFIFWVEIAGIKKGDIEEISIANPDGSLLLKTAKIHKNGQALYLGYAGKKIENLLKKGKYTGHYKLIRSEKGKKQILISKKKMVTIFDK